ncbi:LytTR family DNA-binding domain-containing protein [Spirosoma arcticum]
MAIFVDMLSPLRSFLNRPLAEEFSLRNHLPLALQAGVYVFLFVCLLNRSFNDPGSMGVVAGLSVGMIVVVLVANVLVPKLWPAFYDEDRWTVGRHILQTLFVLFGISCSNQLILELLHVGGPTFGQMYLLVTAIGFFPIMLGVFVAEQRRLKRNLAHAQTLNNQLAHRGEPSQMAPIPSQPTPQPPPDGVPAQRLLLLSENGKERLSLLPDQLLYVESVGNYVDVHWLNVNQPQKTVLRSTLKEVETALTGYPQFFRCHRAFVVNLNMVSHTEGNARGYQLTLTGTSITVPVSRSYLAAFDARLAAVQ